MASEVLPTTSDVYIIGMTVQAILMGMYFASCLLCLRWLVFSDDGGALRGAIHWPFLSITLILFAISVADLGISLRATLLPSPLDLPTAVLYRNVIGVCNPRIE